MSLWTVVSFAMAAAMCSIGHGLHLTAVPRSTQPCILLGSLYRAGVMAGMSSLLGDPIWHVSSCSGEARLLTEGEPLYRVYVLTLLGQFWRG